MKCSHAKLLISWAMDEPLPEYDRARLETHVQSCPGCAEYGTQLDRGRTLMTRAMASPPDNFEWKVQLKIQQALREAAAQGLPAVGRSRFWLPAGITAATTALLVLAVGALVLLDPDSLPGLRGDRQPPAVADNPSLVSVEPGAVPADRAEQPAAGSHPSNASSAAATRPTTPRATLPPRRSNPGGSLRPSNSFGGIQRVGEQLVGPSTLVPVDPRFVGVPEPYDSRLLAKRDQLERALLDAQARSDSLRRQLDRFEYGGAEVPAQVAGSDTLTPVAQPDR